MVFFGAAELLLRATGIPHSKPTTDPYVGFSAIEPLFKVSDGVARTSNQRLKYFNDVSFAAQKRDKSFRVFCFGGSTTYGRPFDGRTSFPRWLEEILKAELQGERPEVINAGGISYASYRITPLIREALQYDPDLMVIYTGHNEFLERRTYAGLFKQGKLVVSVRSLLDRLHLYRLLQGIIAPVATGEGDSQAGTDDVNRQRSTLKSEVDAMLDRSAGLNLYHRDEEFEQGVVEHFRHNLRRMIALCKDARVPVILVEPACNLKDFSPFKSERGKAVGASQRRKMDEKLAATTRLLTAGQTSQALSEAERSVNEDPLYAGAHYLRGRALLAAGRFSEARDSFVAARDLDVCPLRATTPILESVEQIAQAEGVPLIRFEEVLKKVPGLQDRSGIPGDELFLDHVHPVIQGHQALAEEIASVMVDRKIVAPSKSIAESERQAMYARVMRSLDKEFFAEKDLNLAKVLKWAGKKKEARTALERAAKILDNRPELQKMLGSSFLDDKDYAKAVSAYKRAVELSGNDPRMVFGLAVAYHESGDDRSAVETYRLLVDAKEQLPDAYANLATLYMSEGHMDAALAVLKTGMEVSRDSAAIQAAYGLAMAVSNKPDKGIFWMKEALRSEPGNPVYLYNLAGMYSLTGKSEGALECLKLAVKNGYADAEKLRNDPVFSAIRSDARFADAVESLK